MKIKSLQHIVLGAALPLALLASVSTSFAQPGKKGGAVKHVEQVLGKPLTPAQKNAVRAAQKERQQAIKPIQAKFNATVSKALGLTVAQYEEREKALRPKNKGLGAR